MGLGCKAEHSSRTVGKSYAAYFFPIHQFISALRSSLPLRDSDPGSQREILFPPRPIRCVTSFSFLEEFSIIIFSSIRVKLWVQDLGWKGRWTIPAPSITNAALLSRNTESGHAGILMSHVGRVRSSNHDLDLSGKIDPF